MKATLHTHFTPKKNTSAERFKFFNMRPESPEETHDKWVMRLKSKVNDCEFDKLNNEEAIKLVIMLHTHNSRLQRAILSKDLDYKKTLEEARALEMTERELAKIKESGSQIGANKVSIPRKANVSGSGSWRNPNKKNSTCRYCGEKYPHPKDAPCKARSATCYNCNRQGHYSKMCAQPVERKRANEVHVSEEEDVNSLIDCLLIHVNSAEAKVRGQGYPNTKMVAEIEGVPIELNVDSMADANILGSNHLQKLGSRVKLLQTAATIKPYGSPPIQTLGKFKARLSTQKGSAEVEFYVTQDDQPMALLGKYSAFDLGILKIEVAKAMKLPPAQHKPYSEIANLLTPKDTTKNLLKRIYKEETTRAGKIKRITQNHPRIYNGIGKHKYRQVTLPVDPEVPLRIQPQRKVPFAKREKLKKLLRELEVQDVIEVVDGPTDCISNLVLTAKANPEEIRMNIDMTWANEAILRTRHVIPALDEMRINLNGATMFSKLDMKHGYMQLELDEKSRSLTTFYTPEGLRRSKRLIFGANAAAELFQEEIRRSLTDINQVMNIYDDMMVYGKAALDHDYALARVLQRLDDLGLTLNEAKCTYGMPEVTFFGMNFSKDGMSPTSDRVQALRDAAPPKSSHEVRSFLGMANFSAPFISNFSTLTAPLRELTKKNATFQWTRPESEAFEAIKSALSADTVMAFFDLEKETKVIVDGSKKDGVASILAQKDPDTGEFRVIRYDSRATTAPEKNYAPIEVESLAILFALEKNHLYLHGLKEFIVSTDHKPLVTIYTQYRKEISPRVMKHKMALQGKYHFKVIWEAGKNNPADYKSRHPGNSTVDEAATDTEIAVSAVVCDAIPDAITVQEVAEATLKDDSLSILKEAVQKGHLDVRQHPQLKEYAKMFEALSVIDGVVCREDRIVIPGPLQKQVVDIAHEAHQGITKTKQYVRATMWFPRMDVMIEERLRSCTLCQAATASLHKEPIHPTTMPRQPWNTLILISLGHSRLEST